MTYEPNLRYLESHYSGRPYGYGRLPAVNRSLAAREHAVSRPQLNPKGGTAEGDQRGGGINPRRPAVSTPHSYWRRFLDWLDDVPGTIEALIILLLQPLKWLRGAFSLRIGQVAICALVVLVLMLAGIPLITTTNRDARGAEGEQLLGGARDQLRIEFSKTREVPPDFRDPGFDFEEWSESFSGYYYVVEPRIDVVDRDTARIYVRPTQPGNAHGCMEFHWTSGESEIFWEKEKPR